jgi:hypothetical protein
VFGTSSYRIVALKKSAGYNGAHSVGSGRYTRPQVAYPLSHSLILIESKYARKNLSASTLRANGAHELKPLRARQRCQIPARKSFGADRDQKELSAALLSLVLPQQRLVRAALLFLAVENCHFRGAAIGVAIVFLAHHSHDEDVETTPSASLHRCKRVLTCRLTPKHGLCGGCSSLKG